MGSSITTPSVWTVPELASRGEVSLRRATVFLVLALLADLVYSVVGTAWALQRSADDLRASARAIGRGEAAEATAHLESASSHAERVRGLRMHPGAALLSLLPGVSNDVAAAEELEDLISATTELGLDALRPLESEGLLGSAFEGGTVRLERIEELKKLAADTQEMATSEGADLALLDRPLTPQMRSAVSDVMARLDALGQGAAEAQRLLAVMPELLGAGGPKRYLLAFQSPSEARGGGGLFGVYGILEADDGHLELGDTGPVQELNRTLGDDIGAPRWFEELYGPLSALGELRQANLSPSFPTTSELVLDMYESAKGERLDGVIAMDPIVLGKLTRATGPLRGKGWDVEIDAENARRVLLHDIYLEFGQYEGRAQNEYLSSLVDELWSKLVGGQVDPAAAAEALASSVETQHLKLYLPEARDEIAALGADGDVAGAGDDLQMVFHNSFSGSKVDYFLRRTIDTVARLDANGDAEVTTTAVLVNASEGEPGSLLVDPARAVSAGFERGMNRMTLHFLLPDGARDASITLNGRTIRSFAGTDSGHRVVWALVDVPAGDVARVAVTYGWPEAVAMSGDRRFSLALWPQALVRSDLYSLKVHPPSGYRATGSWRGEVLTDGSFHSYGLVKTAKTIATRLEPAP